MANALYDLYSDSIYRLTRTLKIKYSPGARAVNTKLVSKGIDVNVNDPTTWMYYLNLAGEYHPSQTPMMVASLDRPELGLQEFNKQFLVDNTLTRTSYFVGSRYYNELVRRYPDQVDLIEGIISPVDLQTAIDAEDGTILYYDATLVEEQEENVIPKLQDWITSMTERWLNIDYTSDESLYFPVWKVILYSRIPGVIFSIRLENCRTRYVHSYHVRQYLESHGRLGEFIPWLNTSQRLWLYRNIRYVRKFAGHTSTFKELVQRILTDRDLPLSEYRLLQLDDIGPDGLSDVAMRRYPVSFIQTGTGSDVRDIEYIVKREGELTSMDELDVDYWVGKVTDKAKSGPKNELPTKVLESSVIDRTDAVPYPLSDVLLSQWVYWIGRDVNVYRARVSIVLPHTGEQVIMTVREAWFLYTYAWAKGYLDFELPKIEDGLCIAVQRATKPTRAEIALSVDVDVVGNDYLDELDRLVTHNEDTLFSTEEFYDAAVEIQTTKMNHYFTFAPREGIHERAATEMASDLYFKSEAVPFAESGTLYSDWLVTKGLDLSEMTQTDFRALFAEIWSKATGTGENASKTLRETHKAMLRLMARLSSYSIQFLRTINNSEEVVMGGPDIRWDYDGMDESTEENIRVASIGFLEGQHLDDGTGIVTRCENGEYVLDVGMSEYPTVARSSMTTGVWIGTGIAFEPSGTDISTMDLPIPIVGILETWDDELDLNDVTHRSVEEYIYPPQP